MDWNDFFTLSWHASTGEFHMGWGVPLAVIVAILAVRAAFRHL